MRSGYSTAIAFGSFDQKSGLPSQYQQVLIAANQQIGSPALSQVQKRLIVCVATQACAFFYRLDHFAIRKIISQQFSRLVRGEPELWVTEDTRKLRGSCARDQGHAPTIAPMLSEPSQAAVRKQKCRNHRGRIEDHSRAHTFSRVHASASATSCSSIPSWASRLRTSSARLRCSGRKIMHSPSVLTSK
jgi:hypothetical protein